MIRQMYSSNLVTDPYHITHFIQFSVKFLIAIFAIWNLDYFRSFYGYICLYPDLNYQQVLLLEYAIGIYPLFLIFITFFFAKLHDNFTYVVWLWRLFNRCLAVFRRQWNIRSYLMHALTMFIVLSYVKILNTSYELLIPSRLYDVEDNRIHKAYWYYDGRVDMTLKSYLPYLVLALFMLLFFNVFPLALLAFYPFKWFQRFLEFCLSQRYKVALQIFMDSFHGCYKDTAHDYRHFAILYLAVRLLNLLMSSVFIFYLYLPAAALLFVFALALIAKFQPYKCKRNNTVDIVILLAVISCYISSAMYYAGREFVYPIWMNDVVSIVSTFIVVGYFILFILAQVLPKTVHVFLKYKSLLTSKIKPVNVNMEDRALLNHTHGSTARV